MVKSLWSCLKLKTPHFYCFQLLRYEDLMLFFDFCRSEVKLFGFLWLSLIRLLRPEPQSVHGGLISTVTQRSPVHTWYNPLTLQHNSVWTEHDFNTRTADNRSELRSLCANANDPMLSFIFVKLCIHILQITQIIYFYYQLTCRLFSRSILWSIKHQTIITVVTHNILGSEVASSFVRPTVQTSKTFSLQ